MFGYSRPETTPNYNNYTLEILWNEGCDRHQEDLKDVLLESGNFNHINETETGDRRSPTEVHQCQEGPYSGWIFLIKIN